MALDLFNPDADGASERYETTKQVGYEVHGSGVLRSELPDVQALLKLCVGVLLETGSEKGV